MKNGNNDGMKNRKKFIVIPQVPGNRLKMMRLEF